jgi:hypothetical protein
MTLLKTSTYFSITLDGSWTADTNDKAKFLIHDVRTTSFVITNFLSIENMKVKRTGEDLTERESETLERHTML